MEKRGYLQKGQGESRLMFTLIGLIAALLALASVFYVAGSKEKITAHEELDEQLTATALRTLPPALEANRASKKDSPSLEDIKGSDAS